MSKEQSTKKVRILHCGDLHLDSAFSKASISKGEERRAELRSVFSDMMKYVRNSEIDILLITGDLFDSEFATSETLDLLVREFSFCQVPVFISPGNHDPYKEGSIYTLGKFPSNVFIFKQEGLMSVRLEALNTTVYGWAFCDISHRFSPIADKKVKDKSSLNIVCGHTQLDNPLSEYCPVSKSDIESFGADYYAFGHVHVNPEQKRIGKASYAYSGFLEGRSFDECGLGGAWLIEAEKEANSTEYKISTKRLNFARHRYETVTIDVEGLLDIPSIRNKISSTVKNLAFGPECSLRVILTGSIPLSLSLKALNGESYGLNYIEYKDHTTPTYNSEFLLKDMTIKGELYRYLLPMLTDGTTEERETAARALKVALSALENREITTQTEL